MRKLSLRKYTNGPVKTAVTSQNVYQNNGFQSFKNCVEKKRLPKLVLDKLNVGSLINVKTHLNKVIRNSEIQTISRNRRNRAMGSLRHIK
jgi:hypothetical protein